jgi:hypothetical protein
MKNEHITSSPAGHSRKRGGIFFILISQTLAQSGIPTPEKRLLNIPADINLNASS